ncbi:MAG: hypothetical protein ACFFCS_08635, partial [Candidatus Hodarchaeota archaeon]
SITPRNDPEMPTRLIILSIGIVILLVTFIQFLQKFRKRKTRTRLTIIIALIFFIFTFFTKLLTSTFAISVTQKLPRFFYDLPIYCLMSGLYCFLLFGIEVLIIPMRENKRSGLKIVTDVIYIVIFGLYLLNHVLIITNIDIPGLLAEISEYIIYVTVVYYLLIILLMAIRSLSLQKKISDPQQKNGLIALGTSFLLLIGCVLLLVINAGILEHYDKTLEIITICLAMVSFYFVYMGFVRPSG